MRYVYYVPYTYQAPHGVGMGCSQVVVPAPPSTMEHMDAMADSIRSVCEAGEMTKRPLILGLVLLRTEEEEPSSGE